MVMAGHDPSTLKVLYADDHWISRSALRHLIEQLEENTEIFEAGDFTEALEVASNHSDLDLIILDLVMPGMKRFEGLRALREMAPNVPVVVFSAIENRGDILRCIEGGAMGYIPKSSDREEIVASLRNVLNGGVSFPRRQLEQQAAGSEELYPSLEDEEQAQDIASVLTKRQFEIFRLLGHGLSNSDMASRLGLSEHTVRVHVSAIVKRLNFGSRTEAALRSAAQARALERYHRHGTA